MFGFGDVSYSGYILQHMYYNKYRVSNMKLIDTSDKSFDKLFSLHSSPKPISFFLLQHSSYFPYLQKHLLILAFYLGNY